MKVDWSNKEEVKKYMQDYRNKQKLEKEEEEKEIKQAGSNKEFPLGLPYPLDKLLIKKLTLMAERCIDTKIKRDALLIVEGGEGEGKSNYAIAISGAVKKLTGMDIHLFFRVEDMLNFAKSNENKIIIWDEPSLDALSADALRNLNKDLLRLFMTVRKKRHFFIVNFTKFWKFPEYLVVDRALGMLHVYSRNETEIGRSIYIKKKCLQLLWNDYAHKKLRNYKRYKSFFATFPEVMNKHFEELDITINGKPHCTLKDYEDEKDNAINSIGTDKKSGRKDADEKLKELRYKIATLPVQNKESLASHLGVDSARLRVWKQQGGNFEIKIDENS